jgi:hypothetical protein
MNFELRITLSNAAFDHESGGRSAAELARVLHAVADQIAEYGGVEVGDRGACRDINGNGVGIWSVVRS